MIQNRHIPLIIGLVITLIVLPFLTWWVLSTQTELTMKGIEATPPSATEAEETAFTFMLNLLQLAQNPSDRALMETMYDSLSSRAQPQVSQSRFLRDALAFASMQTTPEDGVSVEDLQLTSSQEATLIVGLNYKSGRELRAVHLVVEDAAWKVDLVDTLATYPPEESAPLPSPEVATTTETEVATTTESEPAPDVLSACFIGGCSSQVCSDNPDVATDCAFRPSYACYQSATCERQSDGQCGWTETPELLACIATAAEESI